MAAITIVVNGPVFPARIVVCVHKPLGKHTEVLPFQLTLVVVAPLRTSGCTLQGTLLKIAVHTLERLEVVLPHVHVADQSFVAEQHVVKAKTGCNDSPL